MIRQLKQTAIEKNIEADSIEKILNWAKSYIRSDGSNQIQITPPLSSFTIAVRL